MLGGEAGTLLDSLDEGTEILGVTAVVEFGPTKDKAGLDVADDWLGTKSPDEFVLAASAGHALDRQDRVLRGVTDNLLRHVNGNMFALLIGTTLILSTGTSTTAIPTAAGVHRDASG